MDEAPSPNSLLFSLPRATEHANRHREPLSLVIATSARPFVLMTTGCTKYGPFDLGAAVLAVNPSGTHLEAAYKAGQAAAGAA